MPLDNLFSYKKSKMEEKFKRYSKNFKKRYANVFVITFLVEDHWGNNL